jgi:hypothetical protein
MLRAITFKQGNVTPHVDGIIHKYQMINPTGIYSGFGGECGITAPIDYPSSGQAKVIFNEGIISVQGRHIGIDAGTEFSFSLSATSTGSLGVKIDLSQPAGSEVQFYTKTTQTLTQQDLAENRTTGVYEFEIYKFTATATTVTLGAKTAQIVATNKINLDAVKSYVDDTIASSEQALTLVQKYDNFPNHGSKVVKYGKLVSLHLVLRTSSGTTYERITTIPEGFRPKADMDVYGHAIFGNQLSIFSKVHIHADNGYADDGDVICAGGDLPNTADLFFDISYLVN